MERRSVQAPAAVVIVRPHHFVPNLETAADNAFQFTGATDDEALARRAHDEVTAVARAA